MRFGPTTGIVDALDEVLDAYNWSWWMRTDGKVEFGPNPTYTHADMPMPVGGGLLFLPESLSVAHTIDASSQTGEDVIEFFRTEPERDHFRNYVVVLQSNDVVPSALAGDVDSHQDSSAANYKGVSLWDVRIEPQAGGLDDQVERNARADEVLRMRGEKTLAAHWRTIGHPELAPGTYVDVNSVPDVNVPDGTVFRVMEDTATLDPNGKTFKRQFRLEIVAEYTPPA
jgi:hypothetical protein